MGREGYVPVSGGRVWYQVVGTWKGVPANRLSRVPGGDAAYAGVGLPVYHAMWGPSEFFVTGNLLDYDRTARLGEITIPTLFTCGRFDEATPQATSWYQSLVPGSELAIFEQSAHCAQLEETDRYLKCVGDFVRRADSTLGH